MDLKIKRDLAPGLNLLVTDELEFLRFSILKLEKGESFEERLEDWECAAALLSGHCTAEVEGKGPFSLGPRGNVFDDSPWGLYVPGRLEYRISALAPSELALSYGPWKRAVEPAQVSPAELEIHQRGAPGYEREVRDIIVDKVAADSILVGETVNRPGQWSSYPPHKHDTEIPDVETRLEEIYFYKVNPPQGFGYQRIYTDDRSLDVAVTVENDDLVLLPKGYHPVAAAPGYSVYYFWALAGPERLMTPHDDPQHEWVGKR
jgi:5-deoxy-glucuronate isomerase